VNVGAEHMSVTCVEEGMIVPSSIVLSKFSGRNIDVLLHRLLRREVETVDSFKYIETLKK